MGPRIPPTSGGDVALSAVADASSDPLAEVIRSYSNFSIPANILRKGAKPSQAAPTLEQQAVNENVLLPSEDLAARPRTGNHPITARQKAEVVRLFRTGLSPNAIATALDLSWDSVARLLERAGIRDRGEPGRK